MRFVHGTTTTNLPSIEQIGLAPPDVTDQVTEKRKTRRDVVHLLDERYAHLAGGYALRSTLHFGGEPIIVYGEVPDDELKLAIPGRNVFPDIYSSELVKPEYIKNILPVDSSLEDMPELFKAHKF